MKHAIKYGDWHIHLAYSSVQGNLFNYYHDSFDGPGDSRCGNCWSVSDAIREIDEYELEHGHD